MPFNPCPACEGTGFFTVAAYHPDDPRTEATWDCDECGGTGEVEDDTGPDGWLSFDQIDANPRFNNATELVLVEHLGPGRIAM